MPTTPITASRRRIFLDQVLKVRRLIVVAMQWKRRNVDVHRPLARQAFLFEINAPLDMADRTRCEAFGKRALSQVYIYGSCVGICHSLACGLMFTCRSEVLERMLYEFLEDDPAG
jgi:hypothetical protein